jgi:phosphoribosylformylglycinamidine synthase
VSHWTAPGHAIVLLGETRDELGGSEWLAVRRGIEAGLPPRVDLAHERRLHGLLADTIASGLVATAHDVGSGGLAVALAECGITGPATLRIGCTVELPPGRADVQLFGESTGRVLVATQDADALLERARRADVPARRIGTTGGDRLTIPGRLDVELATLEATFTRAIPRRIDATENRG